jgi:DNA-binding CsgD family transcriptional regulator
MIDRGPDGRVGSQLVGVGIVDTETAEVVAGNAAYARLLERTPRSIVGLPVEAFLAPPQATVSRTVLRSMRDGWVEFLEGETEVHLPSGPARVYSWSQTLGAGLPRRAVIVGGIPMAEAEDPATPPIDPTRIILGTLDNEWRFDNVAARSAALLGWPEGKVGRARLDDVVHPGDRTALGAVLDQPALEQPTTVDVRIRGHADGWLDARVTVSQLFGHATASYAVVIGVDGSLGRSNTPTERLNGLEERLRRIALEVEAAGVLPTVAGTSAVLRASEINDLSPRQLDILARLTAGQRVPVIAKGMHISPSTVRNHLSALFRKFAVHSQSELLDVLRSRHSDWEDDSARLSS